MSEKQHIQDESLQVAASCATVYSKVGKVWNTIFQIELSYRKIRSYITNQQKCKEKSNLVNTSNSKFEICSLTVRSMVVFKARVSNPVLSLWTLLNAIRNSNHGTVVLKSFLRDFHIFLSISYQIWFSRSAVEF